MARFTICTACIAGDCPACTGAVADGNLAKPCFCTHGATTAPARVVRTDDPATAGGDVIAVEGDAGEVLVDTRNAVILDGVHASTADNPSDGRTLCAIFLEGRVNQTDRRSAILHITDLDGLGLFVAELIALPGRMGDAAVDEFTTALDRRLAEIGGEAMPPRPPRVPDDLAGLEHLEPLADVARALHKALATVDPADLDADQAGALVAFRAVMESLDR